ncbi:Cell surface protein [Methanosarcina siciliae HI350]|uniref:Cell surface protein n=1 Tax=Methanosarcina siciliae HI350 TaxID=1434119 RepID=A0A0E3PI28_9EURY|nr:PGF-pre-PGF domain-containing protein [Methanosarcina siciliae]AKB34217.1 Cell surface protein [Methanosarcina siciliae HI350]
MLKKIAIIMTIFLISVQAVSAAEVGVGVSPGKLSFELNPGAQEEQLLYVINTGSESASYEINIDDSTYESWFSLSPSSFTLQAGENKEVKVILTVPSSAETDVDCKILVYPTSGTEVMTGIRVPVHVDVVSSNSGSSSGGSSSSSSGGGGGSPEPASNVRVKEISQQFVTNGNHIKFEFPQNATPVTYIEFDAKKSAGKITTIVEELKEKSTLTPTEPEGNIYRYLNIWVGNEGFATPENIENSSVGFKVSKAWVTENEIDIDSITFQHFADDIWNSLSAEKVDEDDEYVYFEAKTPGFSPFAITGQKTGYSTEVKADEEESGIQDMETRNSVESENEGENDAEPSPGFCSILTGAGIIISAVIIVKRKSL